MSTMEETQFPRQLDPVLRELVAFGLVEKQVSEDRTTWALIEAAQHRLTVLDRPVPEADSMFFVGHRCDGCGEHAVTRRIGARYLCSLCGSVAARMTTAATADAVQPESAAVAISDPPDHHGGERRRRLGRPLVRQAGARIHNDAATAG